MTPGAAKAKRRAKAAEEATVEAIEEGTERIRRSVKRGSRAAARSTKRGVAKARHTLLDTIRLLPAYLRLLAGLLTDRRVPPLDKILVGAALAYAALPADIIPDWIPFIGQVDDVYVVVVAIQRMITNAGKRVVRSHWDGPMHELEEATLAQIVSAAAVFLPRGIRRKLRSRR